MEKINCVYLKELGVVLQRIYIYILLRPLVPCFRPTHHPSICKNISIYFAPCTCCSSYCFIYPKTIHKSFMLHSLHQLYVKIHVFIINKWWMMFIRTMLNFLIAMLCHNSKHDSDYYHRSGLDIVYQEFMILYNQRLNNLKYPHHLVNFNLLTL